jgi:signal transduction histidine kinase
MSRFRTRARAVDMLGRQQIAGIPTAISELFKNAHDAYADHVEVDFYRRDGLLVLRDDGIGMSREDFEDRWLTIGTESKLSIGKNTAPRDLDKPLRPIMGEKGIGRLAIAAIGPQLLVLTRPKSGSVRPITVAYINWAIFAIPAVNLDQIEIPTVEFDGDHLLTRRDVANLVETARRNLKEIAPARMDAVRTVRDLMDRFDVDPAEIYGSFAEPLLGGDGHGTHFLILPTDESLPVAIDAPDDEWNAPPLVKTLLGFTNTMTPGHADPLISAAFRDHKLDGTVDNVIEPGRFFTPAEFDEADHHIEGDFDEFGQFRGTVTVYGEPTTGHVVNWPGAGGVPTACGSFRISLAIVQGTNAESTLPADEWVRITRKMNRIGGLYIYKDGIRVLPYGNPDYDFVDIELNRTKGMAYYYFSYRRMFGVVQITSRENGALSEKAGREGFRENRAYRQFRDILRNFFVQIAADFFREGGLRATTYVDKKSEISRIEKARRKQEKLAASRRATISAELESFFRKIENGEPAQEVESIIHDLSAELSAASEASEPQVAANVIVAAESRARKRFEAIASEYRVSVPRGLGLTKRLKRELQAQQREFQRLVTDVVTPRAQEAERLISEATQAADVLVDRRLRFDAAVAEAVADARRGVTTAADGVRRASAEAAERVAGIARDAATRLEQRVRDVVVRVQHLDIGALDNDQAVAARAEVEEELRRASADEIELLGALAEQVRRIRVETDADTGFMTDLDATEALEEEVLALREQSEADLELAQLGMAIQVITHEFDAAIRGVRRAIRELSTWAATNPELKRLYNDLRKSFDHLDGYLALFTPLQRRLYQKRVAIHGAEIMKFIVDLFGDRIRRHNVQLDVTSKFKRHRLVARPSTIYPVFVNLVDNAMFWLADVQRERVIRMDVEEDRLLVSDTGPGIAARDRDSIFEMGFSRRPGGRGMGLYISRAVLAKEGYSLNVVEPRLGHGSTFEIRRLTEEPEADEDGAE